MPESAFEAVNGGKLPDDKWQHWTQADTIAARTGLGSWNRKDIMAACTGHPRLLRHAHWQHPTEHTLTHVIGRTPVAGPGKQQFSCSKTAFGRQSSIL